MRMVSAAQSTLAVVLVLLVRVTGVNHFRLDHASGRVVAASGDVADVTLDGHHPALPAAASGGKAQAAAVPQPRGPGLDGADVKGDSDQRGCGENTMVPTEPVDVAFMLLARQQAGRVQRRPGSLAASAFAFALPAPQASSSGVDDDLRVTLSHKLPVTGHLPPQTGEAKFLAGKGLGLGPTKARDVPMEATHDARHKDSSRSERPTGTAAGLPRDEDDQARHNHAKHTSQLSSNNDGPDSDHHHSEHQRHLDQVKRDHHLHHQQAHQRQLLQEEHGHPTQPPSTKGQPARIEAGGGGSNDDAVDSCCSPNLSDHSAPSPPCRCNGGSTSPNVESGSSSTASDSADGTKTLAANQLHNALLCDPVVHSIFDDLEAIAQRDSVAQLVEDILPPMLGTSGPARIAWEQASLLERAEAKNRPLGADFFVAAARLYRALGATSSAIECYRRAIVLNAKEQGALLALSDLLYNLGYFNDARSVLGYSIEECDAATFQNHFQLGRTLQALDDFSGAMVEFEVCLSLKPTFFPCQKLLAATRLLLKAAKNRTNSVMTAMVIGCCIFVTLVLVYIGISSGALAGPGVPGPHGPRKARLSRGSHGSTKDRVTR
eukprot:m.48077 g.48077  ORF g.48077 m.48077 type:complete len:604 (+) comp11967_c0_seq1:141-1952(+)